MKELPTNYQAEAETSGASTSNNAKIRLLVVDDHEVVRKGLVVLLGLEPDIEVCGEANNGLTAVKLAQTLLPDLVLMDLKMPGMNGVEAGRLVKTVAPGCKVLILTGVDIDALIFKAVQSGIDGYVLKEVRSAELIRAVRVVASGGAYLDQTVTRKVLMKLSSLNSDPTLVEAFETDDQSTTKFATTSNSEEGLEGANKELTENLSEREREVLRGVALGQSSREIGEALTVSEGTIRSHLKNIFRKLSVNDRTQAVVVALKQGLIQLS